MDGNEIQGVEKYCTENKKKKPIYDKVMKIMGLTDADLNEKVDKNQ